MSRVWATTQFLFLTQLIQRLHSRVGSISGDSQQWPELTRLSRLQPIRNRLQSRSVRTSRSPLHQHLPHHHLRRHHPNIHLPRLASVLRTCGTGACVGRSNQQKRTCVNASMRRECQMTTSTCDVMPVFVVLFLPYKNRRTSLPCKCCPAHDAQSAAERGDVAARRD